MPGGSGWKCRHACLAGDMGRRDWAAHNLAARLLAGPWTRPAIAAAIKTVLGPAHPMQRRALATRLARFGDEAFPYRWSPRMLAGYLRRSEFFVPARDKVVAAVLDEPCFTPVAAFAGLAVPRLATVGALADWLGLEPAQLDWLADTRRGMSRTAEEKLQHYRYVVIHKPGGRVRLLEAPKPRLKAIQRRILREILALVPVHPAAHGFVAGRSCLSGAQIHAGEAVVAAFDLAQFFPTIAVPRVHGLFRALGYPWAVAQRLAGLCTTATPAGVCRGLPDRRMQALYAVPHLPQGAPSSPALANLLAWTLDVRLHGLARRLGANYTRYADDIAFSGDADFAGTLPRLPAVLETILRDEGFALNAGKTRIMPASTRQRVTGIIVNGQCNVPRETFDTLKAILHNCIRSGPAGQNRAAHPDFRAHIEGRVAWVEQINPPRGAKLRDMFERVDWPPPAV